MICSHVNADCRRRLLRETALKVDSGEKKLGGTPMDGAGLEWQRVKERRGVGRSKYCGARTATGGALVTALEQSRAKMLGAWCCLGVLHCTGD